MNGSTAALLLVVALGACALLALVALLARVPRRPTDDPTARTMYLDEGRGSRTFVSERHRLRAKPDKLEGDVRDATLVELKSRPRGIHAADRAQIIATALAVRAEGIHVARARLETLEDEPVTLDLAPSDAALFERIRPAVEAARLALGGTAPAPAPSVGKCRACGYRARCPHRADAAPSASRSPFSAPAARTGARRRSTGG